MVARSVITLVFLRSPVTGQDKRVRKTVVGRGWPARGRG
jgi:hypothetical protein